MQNENATKALMLVFFFLLALISTAQERKPDFSGTWLLDVARSGPEPEVWLQRRAARFIVQQRDEEITIDTGDGSLFGVTAPVTETPLRYVLDGSIVIVPDHSLGDLPNFSRKISTQIAWEDDSRLWTFTTHFVETPKRSAGTTRVLIFSLAASGRELQVERTG
jgi:hypothetical protein